MLENVHPVLVVDFGAQYAQLIARRVRDAHVYSEIVPRSMPIAEMLERKPAAIILSGGPASVHVDGAPTIDPALYESGVPLLGICYGAQLIATQLGGEVAKTGRGEYGRTDLHVPAATGLFHEQPLEQVVWMSHFDTLVTAPPGFAVLASTDSTPVAALGDRDRAIYGVQFHPEVAHTERGMDILKAFLYDVAGCAPTWTNVSIIEQAVAEIRAQVGKERVICGLSGGVDSAVAAALVHKAIGDQLTCVFVDTGLLRHAEAEQVEETFRRQFAIDLVHVKAGDRFLAALDDVIEPERKRKIIGELFIRLFEETARDLADTGAPARFLVQGTLYPDIVESGGGDNANIKSHHNVGGLPEDMDFDLVEPLRHLFKDEVRAVGEELGLPEEIVWRQPFPGPGLAVRIIGTITPERVDILQQADAVVVEEIRRAGLYREIWQSFAVLPAVRTVGVMGDDRTYAYPIIIRAVTSDDAMTADWARLPYEVLERIASRIINEVPGVNRVAYDITSKPPGTIEWEWRAMNIAELNATARAIVAPGKGILAADESSGTIKKRFDAISCESTEDRRRAYREMLFTTKGAAEFVSGVILFDETIRQSASDGRTLVKVLQDQGLIPGIKVDKGAKPLAGAPGELVTEGLDGLRERLAEYRGLGARFAKWRAVITIGDEIPSAYCIDVNAHALARYAALCQEAEIVPIVEPEVLMDGSHTIERCDEVTRDTLHTVFNVLYHQGVALEGMLLKPNMVLSGKDCKVQASVDEVAEATIACFRATVPAALPGIVFLSGGQSDEIATAHLDAMNRRGPHPWQLSFSYGRALQAPAIKAWGGSDANAAAGQAAYLKRARLNGAARSGDYTADLEHTA